MSKPLKKMLSEDLRRRYAGVESACVVDLTGLDVAKTRQIRGELTQKKMRLEVVKNSMVRLAFTDGPLGPLAKAMTGPCAWVTGGDSIVDIAKTLLTWAKPLNFKLKRAIVEGDPGLMTIEEVSKLKGRRDLLGELAMLISSPGRAVAGCLQGPQSQIAGCLKTMADQGEATNN